MKFLAKAAFAILPALLLLGCGTSGEVKDEGEGGQVSEQVTGMDSSTSTQGTGDGSDMMGERMGGGAEDMAATVDPLNDPSSLCSASA